MSRVKKGINEKERRVLEIIKCSDAPLTTNEIMEIAPELNKNAVQPAVRTLLEMNLIEIVDIVMEKSAASRRFQMTKEAPQIIADMFLDEYKSLQRLVGKKALFSALISDVSKGGEKGKKDSQEIQMLLDDYIKKRK